MKFAVFAILLSAVVLASAPHAAWARARYGSMRVGGYTSSGKGSHYVGGYVRSCHGIACR